MTQPAAGRVRSTAWAAACLLAVGLLTLRARGVLEQAPQWEGIDTYLRVQAWVDSGNCMLRTGIPLVVCQPDGTGIRAIEEASPADDRGHALIADAVAFASRRPVTRGTLIRINLAVNVIATCLLALLLWLCGYRVSALGVVVAGAMLAMLGPHPGPDSHSSYIGAYMLSLLAVLWAAQLARPDRSPAWRSSGLLLGAAGLAAAVLLREPYGLGGLVAALSTLAFVLRGGSERGGRRAHLLPWIVSGAVIFIVAVRGVTPGLIVWRERGFGVPRGELVLEHGIAHNLYLGLGAEPNPWGLVWDDGRGARDVSARDPGVAFVSDRYFQSAFALWWGCVRTDPVAAMRIYGTKTWKSLYVWAGERPRRMAGFASALAVMTILLARRRTRVAYADAAWIFGAGMGVLGVLSQGVLGFPASAYIDPGRIGICVLLLAMTDAMLRTQGTVIRGSRAG